MNKTTQCPIRCYEAGIILPILAVVLSGLLGLALILAVDNYIISQGAITLRQGLDSVCRTLATRAELQRSVVTSQDLFTMTESHLGAGSRLRITRGILYLPTMPNGFKRPTSVPDVSLEEAAFPKTTVTHEYPNDRVYKCTAIEGASCTYLNGKKSSGGQVFFDDSIDSYYDSGSYIGCRIEAEVQTWWPRDEVAKVSATVSYSSRLRNLDPRVLKNNVSTGFPSIVLAVAPQINTTGRLPDPIGGPVSLDANAFPLSSFDYTKYPPASLVDFGNLSLLRPTELNGAEKVLAWPLLSSSSGDTQQDVRETLYSLCASPPVVLRQRFSSALAELLSRNGVTRRSTNIVATNPRGDPDPSSGGSRIPSPPVFIISNNQDLRWREFNIPLMNFNFAPDLNSVPQWLDPFATSDTDPNLQKNLMYQALLARMPGLCYHLDSEISGRRKRLNLPANLDFSTYPYNNDGFENSNEFSGSPTLATAPFSPDASYLDLLNMWRQGMVEPIDENHRTLGSAITAPGQRMLSAPEILSSLGAHIRCPFRSGRIGYDPCGGSQKFEPDILSLLSAWRNHTENRVWKAPGLFQASVNAGNKLKPLSPQVRRPTLVLFLHSISQAQLNEIAASGLIETNNYNNGPLVIVYIPTGGTPPIGVSWTDTAKAVKSTFQASECRAVANEGDPVEENVIIPLIPKPAGGLIGFGGDFECVRELYPCTEETSFEDMWECFLQDPESLTSIESNVRDKFYAPVPDGPILEVIRRQ